MANKTKLSEQLRHRYDAIDTRVSDQINQVVTLMSHKGSIERLNTTIDDLWKAADELHDRGIKDLDITEAIFWLQCILAEIRERFTLKH